MKWMECKPMTSILHSKPILATGIGLFFFWFSVCAQISFVPPSYNYTSNTYNAGNQNWSVAQAQDGIIYIANNDGLLSFDGVNWKLHKMPNNLGVKSIFIDSSATNEKIYVGSYEEFGYFEKNSFNQLTYNTLIPLVKNYNFMNDEIWTISKYQGRIFFQSFSSYFIYHPENKEVKPFKPIPGPLYFFSTRDNLYAQFIESDFCRFTGDKFEPLLSKEQLMGDVIVGIVPRGETLLLFSSKNGVFEYNLNNRHLITWKTDIDEQLNHMTLNRVVHFNDSSIAVGTLEDGIYILNSDGRLNLHLNKSNGLNNNTVLGLFVDKDHNIWAALDNGISYLQINAPISFYEPNDIQMGLVEDILADGNVFYFATNQGIYIHENSHIFHLPEFEIQSWFIRKFGRQIIVGHNKGTAFLENRHHNNISESSTGGTDIKNAKINGQDILLQSTYTALQVYKNSDGQWKFSHKVNDFFDLISQIEVDHTGNIWAGHMYKGIYRLRTDQDIQSIVEREYIASLDSSTNFKGSIKLMKLRGRMVFTDSHKFYTYDDINLKITPFSQLNSDIPELANTHRIVAVNDSAYWFVRNDEYTLVEYKNGVYAIKAKIPFNALNNPPNKGRGNVYVDDNGVSYFCLNGGIGKYVPIKVFQAPWQELSISSIISTDGRKTTKSHQPTNKKNTIPFSENNVNFQYQYPNYSKRTIRIENFLEGYDTDWTTVESANLATNFTNLPAGNYVLRARAMDEFNQELSAISYAFQIKNPWYKSSLAYIIYTLLALAFIVLFIKLYIGVIVKKENKLFAEKERERLAQLDKQEKLIAELKNEQLEDKLIYKSKELASASMLIINQEEMLNKLKKLIQKNIHNGKIQLAKGMEIIKMIDENLSDEDEWALFLKNFDLIHENFFHKLNEMYPSLTSTDLRLCALLKLNYTSKDIAKMLNLTLRGVEAARYRIRKKLALSESENLTTFMINFK